MSYNRLADKRRIAEINLGNYGSTGKIIYSIIDLGKNEGCSFFFAYPQSARCIDSRDGDYVILKDFRYKVNQKLYYYTGIDCTYSLYETIKLISALKEFRPDIIHIHNIHKSFLNFPVLFHYIKSERVKVVWTLHDCWSFTGRCPHFILCKCDRWKTGCGNCPYPKESYPATRIDTTSFMWKKKRGWFKGIQDMTIVTPSEWLASLVKESFLKEYPVKVINNGIDLNVFKPVNSSFREDYHIIDKFIVLGVSFGWGYRKGLDVFIELSKRLPENFQIVLVGTDESVDELLPPNIISIHRTNNQEDLAKIYTAADVFVNPTREENFPTVNIEALACGTPVMTFCTGGSPEIVNTDCGTVIDVDDIDELEKQLIGISTNMHYQKSACIRRAEDFDANDKFEEYIRLFHSL